MCNFPNANNTGPSLKPISKNFLYVFIKNSCKKNKKGIYKKLAYFRKLALYIPYTF
nr:MAG TPA: hypothetical protein [Caudoviricetes sp.]